MPVRALVQRQILRRVCKADGCGKRFLQGSAPLRRSLHPGPRWRSKRVGHHLRREKWVLLHVKKVGEQAACLEDTIGIDPVFLVDAGEVHRPLWTQFLQAGEERGRGQGPQEDVTEQAQDLSPVQCKSSPVAGVHGMRMPGGGLRGLRDEGQEARLGCEEGGMVDRACGPLCKNICQEIDAGGLHGV